MEDINQNIRDSFQQSFYGWCHEAVIEGYLKMLMDTAANFSEWEEENLTARLKKEMLDLPLVKRKKIDVIREYQLDDDAIISGEKKAKSAKRIDFRFLSKWASKVDFEYFAEAKNLYQTDRRSTGDASDSRAYYIDGGIARFVNGEYPYGFMLGYVLRGEIDEVVFKINNLISNRNSPRIGKISEKETLHAHPFCFTSLNIALGNELKLRHIFLKF